MRGAGGICGIKMGKRLKDRKAFKIWLENKKKRDAARRKKREEDKKPRTWR